jgi:hypothetical protein
MKVRFTELPELPVEKMEVVECDDHLAGECVGYRCQECGEADETLSQVYHDPDCSLAGQHGRRHYDDLKAARDDEPTAELDPENPLWLVKSAETDPADGVHNGEIVAVKCECGNMDDDLFEIVHDSRCALADEDCEHGTTDADDLAGVRGLATDGGQ